MATDRPWLAGWEDLEPKDLAPRHEDWLRRSYDAKYPPVDLDAAIIRLTYEAHLDAKEEARLAGLENWLAGVRPELDEGV